MRFLLLLISTSFASALPDREEARRRLASALFEERQALTMEFWEAGKAALPLLRELKKDPDPEVANRAAFVLKRLGMGLGPEAPDDLLKLAEEADQAPFESRSKRLDALLEHDAGFEVALFFLNQWLSNEAAPNNHRISLSEIFVESLLEQRKNWESFFNHAFCDEARAFLVGALCIQDSSTKERMVAILASQNVRTIHQRLTDTFDLVPQDTTLTLGRLATLQGDPDLALEILSRGLARSDAPDLARAIAFLEKSAVRPPVPHKGPWLDELRLLRARAIGADQKILHLASAVADRPVLFYESNLLAGRTILPAPSDSPGLAEMDLLPVWHEAFSRPPEEPDIEALTSSVLAGWPVLVRTLTALARPVEAAERLTSENQIASALGLLWRSGYRDQALALARNALEQPGKEQQVEARLTLATLFLGSGEPEKAKHFFKPLFTTGIPKGPKRRKAIRLALRLYPIEQVTTLEPALTSGRAIERQQAAVPFLEFPPLVTGYWHEHFFQKEPEKEPVELLKQVRNFLTLQTPEARRIISGELAKRPRAPILSGDSLYQNALFLKAPEALELVEEAAWLQLNSKDLRSIIRSEDWPLKARLRALASALALDPIDPILRWYDLQLNGNGDSATIAHATLGNPTRALRLASLTGEREPLSLAARVATFTDPATLRALGILGQSHLQHGEPDLASRLLLASLLGEVATGARSRSSIQETLDTLTKLFQARLELAVSAQEKTIWETRLKGLGCSPLPSE